MTVARRAQLERQREEAERKSMEEEYGSRFYAREDLHEDLVMEKMLHQRHVQGLEKRMKELEKKLKACNLKLEKKRKAGGGRPASKQNEPCPGNKVRRQARNGSWRCMNP